MTIASFVFFTALVAVITFILTRKDDHASSDGFFLAGRSLTFPLIAGSLLLTNLSTEQLVGLNGLAFSEGMIAIVWEVVSVASLVAMALFFLPKFLRSGVTTVPEYLEIRFDHQTQVISNAIFLAAYSLILLPILLYTGAIGLMGILDVKAIFGMEHEQALVAVIVTIAIVGALYALWGGLRTVAVSDLINGVGLLVGGLLITYLGLKAIGNGGVVTGVQTLYDAAPEKMNSIGGKDQSVPVSTILSGVILLTTFYWCTNQQIIQRTFGAKSLAEGQKGVLTAGIFKLLAPLIVVIPGIIAFVLFAQKGMNDVPGNEAYGKLVNMVLPPQLTGFFGAVLLGAVLSSFNSALNSACTLFSLGMYKPRNPEASEADIVRSGRIFGLGITIIAVIIAPILDSQGTIFNHLQKMNAIYFIPILAVVLVGMTTGRVPAKAAKITLIGGVIFIAMGYWVPPFSTIVASMNDFYFLGIVFMHLIAFMLIYGGANPMEEEFVQVDVGAIDMTPWPHAKKAGAGLIIGIIAIYVAFADFSVLKESEDAPDAPAAEQIDADVPPAPASDSDAASPDSDEVNQ